MNNELNTLYIIGNRFDKYHNLPTGYNKFHEFVIDNTTELEDIFEDCFLFSNENDKDLWSSFEEDLGTFNWKMFFEDICEIDINDDDFKPSLAFGLEDDLKQETENLIGKIRLVFKNWLESINLESVKEKLYLGKNSFYVNFNYTFTLEEVYHISNDKIFHIHGNLDNVEDDLILGHNKSLEFEDELDINGDSNRTLFSDSERIASSPFYDFQKPVMKIISENQSLYENFRMIKNIIILGHSLNQIDLHILKRF